MSEGEPQDHPAMTEAAFRARLAEFANDPAPAVWWWMSFVGPDGFAGVVLMLAPNSVQACRFAHALSLNPGGEVSAFQLEPFMVVQPGWLGRILSKDEAMVAASVLDRQFADHAKLH